MHVPLPQTCVLLGSCSRPTLHLTAPWFGNFCTNKSSPWSVVSMAGSVAGVLVWGSVAAAISLKTGVPLMQPMDPTGGAPSVMAQLFSLPTTPTDWATLLVTAAISPAGELHCPRSSCKTHPTTLLCCMSLMLHTNRTAVVNVAISPGLSIPLLVWLCCTHVSCGHITRLQPAPHPLPRTRPTCCWHLRTQPGMPCLP